MLDTNVRQLWEQIKYDLDKYEETESPPRPDLDRLQQELGRIFNVTIERLPDREHVYSYVTAINIDQDYRPTNPDADERIKFGVHIFLSWVVPYATVGWKMRLKPQEWVAIKEEQLPAPLREADLRIKEVLTESGYRVLSGPILQRIVPGRSSELDDSPVSVFEVLFSAID